MRRQAKIIELRSHSKEHFAWCDEQGMPLLKTLCGLAYESNNRIGNKPVALRSGKECKACGLKFDVKFCSLRSRRSEPESLKLHFSQKGSRPVCGQDCAGESIQDISKVTCLKCLELA